MLQYVKRWKYFILLILLQQVLVSQAQVTIFFNPAIAGREVKGLSLLQVVNRSSDQYTGVLEVELRNLSGSGSFMKMTVPSIIVLPGTNLLSPAKLASAVTNYAGSEEGNYVRQTGMMPEGELEYCFKLTLSAKNRPDEIFENCFLGTNIMSSPMRLVTPLNGDDFCEKRPRFSWQPPLPLSPGTRFHVKLVQVKEGQAAGEALLTNTPVFYQSNLNGFMLTYPAGIPDLKEGYSYAWQVSAVNKGIQSLSEIWEFSIACQKSDSSRGSFRELKASDDGGFLSTGSTLRFAVFNAYTESTLQYNIADLTNPEKSIKYTPSIRLQKGANNISIDLNKLSGMEEGNEYSLTVVLPDGGKVSVRFKYEERD